MEYCLPEHRRNEKQGHRFLALESLFSHLFSLWDVLHGFAGCFFQAFSCHLLALYTVSLSLLHHRKLVISYWEMANWWREAVTAEWQGVFCTIHNKCTKLDVPVTHIHPHVSSLWHLSLLGLVLFSITPFCQMWRNCFLPKQGDFQQTMGLSLGGRLLID